MLKLTVHLNVGSQSQESREMSSKYVLFHKHLMSHITWGISGL